MILEEHHFELENYQELDKNKGVVDGKRVELLDRRSDAIEFGARGKNALEGFRTLSGYQMSNGDIATYSTEEHSHVLGLSDAVDTYELPFDNVIPGSMLRPWQYRKDKSLEDVSEEDCEDILNSLGVDYDQPKNVINALLSLPINERDRRKDATSEIYVKGDGLGFEGDPTPLIDDLIVETGVEYPVGREARFYHAEPEAADMLEMVRDELDLNSRELIKYVE